MNPDSSKKSQRGVPLSEIPELKETSSVTKTKLWNFLFSLTIFSVFSINAKAVELYSFFDNQCREVIGYLVSERNNVYDILSFDGKIISLHKDNVKGVLVYNFVNPPLKKIKLKKNKLKNIITLSIQSEGRVDVFSGFPLQFIEDLIVFLGINGSVRVHKMDSILKIRPFKGKKVKKPGKNTKLNIQSVGYMQSCMESGRKGYLRPNRILVDKIKIQQFLSSYKKGYEGLKSFQERTYLYARPMIYNQKTKFGMIYQKALEKSFYTDTFPFIEWSSGRPFRVQNFNQVGLVFNEYGADLDPILGFKAEIKAHFFHSVFVGNFEGLSAGKDFFIKSRLLKTKVKKFFADSGLNYSAMVGGDLGSHSLSVVLYYPVYIFGSGHEVREILATNNSYALRYMYTNSFLRFYTVTSFRDKNIENSNDENIRAFRTKYEPPLEDSSFTEDEKISIENYHIKSFFVRSGVDFDLPNETYLGFNLLMLNLDYNEQPDSGNVKLNRMGGSVYARKNFGDYISFGLRINYLKDKVSGRLNGETFNNNTDGYILGFEGGLVF